MKILRKGVYPYEYMDSWQRSDETSLRNKEAFYSNLNMEDITDVDYKHGKTVFEYHDRISVSEGINVNKTSTSKECDVWHY